MAESPKIETERLFLTLVKRSHLAALFEVNADDAVTKYLPYSSWRSINDGHAWLERAFDRLDKDQAAQFAIVNKNLEQAIGTCLLTNMDRDNGRAEVGYVLGREYWGKGYMAEAMQSFLRFAFTQLDLRRLEAELDPANRDSAKLLNRLGFIREGLLRQRWCQNGEISDSAIYGLLRHEWRQQYAQQSAAVDRPCQGGN